MPDQEPFGRKNNNVGLKKTKRGKGMSTLLLHACRQLFRRVIKAQKWHNADRRYDPITPHRHRPVSKLQAGWLVLCLWTHATACLTPEINTNTRRDPSTEKPTAKTAPKIIERPRQSGEKRAKWGIVSSRHASCNKRGKRDHQITLPLHTGGGGGLRRRPSAVYGAIDNHVHPCGSPQKQIPHTAEAAAVQ